MATDQLDILPMLGRGKHRSPRRGACFMELASYLAGERWSDRPACTHPLLAHLARLVNDATSDAGRPRLAPLIPSVIGLTSPDPQWSHEIAHLVARRALPVVAEGTQRALAVGLLTMDRLMAPGDDRDPDVPRPTTSAALESVPLATRWARDFIGRGLGGGTHHPGPAILDFAVPGLARACVRDPDAALRDLLREAVDACETLAGRQCRDQLDPTLWRPVCAPAPAN